MWSVSLWQCLVYSYEVGTVYNYRYTSSVSLNEITKEEDFAKNVDFKISSEVQLVPLWQDNRNPNEKLLRLKLKEIQINAISRKGNSYTSMLDESTNIPLYLLWSNGIIEKIYTNNNDVSNILKGIASNFQLQTIETTSTEISEVDVSGECKMKYKVNKNKIQKQKVSCTYPEEDSHHLHSNKIQSPTILFSSETEYELLDENKVINHIVGKEYLKTDATFWKQAGITVKSIYELNLKDQEKMNSEKLGDTLSETLSKLSKETGVELKEETLIAKPLKYGCKENCKPLSNLVTDFKSKLEAKKLSTLESASTFVTLLEKFHLATKNELLEILKNRKNNNIIPQILDLISATQTDAAFEAALEFLDFSGKNIDLPERFLLGLSVTSHPTPKMITELLNLANKKISNEKLRTTLLMTLGSVLNFFCKIDDSYLDLPIVNEVVNHYSNKLNKCKKLNCKLMYLRGLKNAALPSTVPLLLEYAKKGKPFAEIALSAIKKMDPKYINEIVVSLLQELYHEIEEKQDSTVRILSAELLLSSQYNNYTIDDILLSFVKRKNPEISTYITGKINDLTSRNKTFSNILKSRKIRNYNTLSNKGDSAVVRNLLAGGTGVDIYYSMDMEMISGGLLKKSAFDVNFENEKDKLHFFSIGLFATGLGSLVGEEDSEETSAGMELTLLGVHIRPYTFFHGTGELMSHVWSGTGSEPISAIQGNLLLMDHSQKIILQNGLIVDLNVKGALSIDLSASIDISIWNRNSHSVVKNSGAFAIEGSARIDSSFIASQVGFNLGGESYIDFVTDFDFYDSPYRTCLQMSQPDLEIIYNVKESHSFQKHKWQHKSNRKYYIPGKSYSFHRKNDEYCSILLAEKY
ncbi:microsomal triglyceride transfer protein large subunit-like isoform X2 [Centruroides vittatus]|uniref:microsomal triglyceride transfer protein large subunit-like isoform X2 n=1 Tax=Centruroides vittatus TaxID=120091 RepID=UPI00350F2995